MTTKTTIMGAGLLFAACALGATACQVGDTYISITAATANYGTNASLQITQN